VLTDQGRALLAVARAVEGNADLFMAQAKSLAGGLEAELSVAVDIMFHPRLKALKDRHLFMPHGSDYPEILRSICR
jgi:predicted transcriptional regulator